MHEDVEDEFASLLASEIGFAIDKEIRIARGMIPADEFRYGQKIYVPYIGLDGLEKGEICEIQWLNTIKRCAKKKLKFSRRFPFVSYETTYYTDVSLNRGTIDFPKWKHIYALENPSMIARKFGIEYNDTTEEFLKDQLEHGDK